MPIGSIDSAAVRRGRSTDSAGIKTQHAGAASPRHLGHPWSSPPGTAYAGTNSTHAVALNRYERTPHTTADKNPVAQRLTQLRANLG